MRESVPTARYSPVCNVLRQWKTSLILTYRVYRLYDINIGKIRIIQQTREARSARQLAKYNNNFTNFKVIKHIIESVDSISRDDRGFPLTQYITNGRISRARYIITHFKNHNRILRLISNRMKALKCKPSA